MTNTETNRKIHEGKNVKRFREMLGIKQEALAFELGDDWTQKKVSVLESKEAIEADVLEQVAKILKVPVEAIKNFSEEVAVNIIASTFNDSTVANTFRDSSNANFHCTFNPLDKVVELYERMLKEKDEIISRLETLIKEK